MVKGLVSIIIPTYKGHETLRRSVDSALSQTYKEVEIIVVDDNGRGSEEQLKTAAELKCYLGNERVHYITHEKNINGAAARNTGIKASNGEYVAFLDDDDEFFPNNIQEHLVRFEQVPDEYVMTYCGMELYAQNKAVQKIMPSVEGDVLFDFLCGKIRIGSSLIVVKRYVIDEIDGFDETFRRHQDWEFIVRILEHHKIAKVKNIGVKKYNLGRNNAPNARRFEENRIHYLNKMESIIKSFPAAQQTQIYDSHYSVIGKEYLRCKDIKGCISWTQKTSRPFYYYIKHGRDAFKSLTKTRDCARRVRKVE